MNDRSALRNAIVKMVVAVLMIGALFAFVGKDLAPRIPTGTWLLYCGMGVVGFFVVTIAVAVVGLSVRQFILGKGGTDAQWFWFDQEPKGLVEWRSSKKRAAANETEGTSQS